MSGVGKNCEILCATGTVRKIYRKVVIFVVYVPPDCRTNDLTRITDTLTSKIASIKSSTKNPIILLGGV